MKRVTLSVLTIIVLALLPAAVGAVATGDVNVFIGTGGRGFGIGSDFPGPCLPFGMARPGPDTANLAGVSLNFYHCGGYHYPDNALRGFSSYRLSGIGVADYGDVRVMPTLKLSGDYRDEASYRQYFSHYTETARPGYYAVTMWPSGIRAELTAAQHAALHRYNFPRKVRARILIDAGRAIGKDVCSAEMALDEDKGTVTGKLLSCGSLSGRSGGTEMFFAARLRGKVIDAGLVRGPGKENQPLAVAWLEGEFGPDAPALVEVGLSFISVAQARLHLNEVEGRSFDEVASAAEAAWAKELRIVEVEGGTAQQRAIFATALYHSFIQPTDFTEAGNLYRGFDERSHEAIGFRYYTDFSLWDTFRTLQPLLNLLLPARAGDMMRSLVTMAEQGKTLPRWPTAYRYTGCMIGMSADNVIADAVLKGITNFDVARAFDAGLWAATVPAPEDAHYDHREGLADYLRLGYVPANAMNGSVSRTIEYSYNDWCLAQTARYLGRDADYRMLMERSKKWRKLYDPKTGYLRAKTSDGAWSGRFNAWYWASYYTEGNARQWLWAPVHDMPGMIELMGGPAEFTRRLNHFFAAAARRPGSVAPDFFYWHGNEPDIHAAYLFNFSGRPDLAQKWVRWVMATKYRNRPAGIDGNDDCGTLSAWYVFSALGLYPLAGSDLYFVGAPTFKRAVLHLPGGDLTIRADPDPARAPYTKRVTINGRELKGCWLRHREIVSGGEIVFEMSAIPEGFSAISMVRPMPEPGAKEEK